MYIFVGGYKAQTGIIRNPPNIQILHSNKKVLYPKYFTMTDLSTISKKHFTNQKKTIYNHI